jgi:hypothetical protein
VTQGVDPEFKPKYHKKNLFNTSKLKNIIA